MFRLKIEKVKSNSDLAKERLKKILFNDRIKLKPEDMTNLKKDIQKVLAKYVDVDINSSDISFEDVSGNSVMRADFSITEVRRNKRR